MILLMISAGGSMKRFDRVWALLPECLDDFIDESKSCSRGRWHVTREHAATNVAIYGRRRRAPLLA
jgi:hypothetical protein